MAGNAEEEDEDDRRIGLIGAREQKKRKQTGEIKEKGVYFVTY